MISHWFKSPSPSFYNHIYYNINSNYSALPNSVQYNPVAMYNTNSLCVSPRRSNLPLSISPDDCSDYITFPYGEYYSSMPSVLSSYRPLKRVTVCVYECEGESLWENRTCVCVLCEWVSWRENLSACASVPIIHSLYNTCHDKTQCNNPHLKLIAVVDALCLSECFHDSVTVSQTQLSTSHSCIY